MAKTIQIKYETAPGTKVDGGYFVPDIYTMVRRKGFIGWFFRLFGNWRGYKHIKMYEALLTEQVSLGRAIHVPRGTVTIETTDGIEHEFAFGSEELCKFLDDKNWRLNG